MKVGRNNIDRKVFSLKDFRGVDYASSPLEVKPYRATDMANLLLRDGQLQKRYGFKQLFKLPDIEDFYAGLVLTQSAVKIYQPSDDRYFIVQSTQEGGDTILTLVYRTYINGEWGFEIVQRVGAFSSGLSAAVNIGTDMYIYGNSIDQGILKYDGGKHSLEWVKDYYIPTTTINIPFMKERAGVEVGDETNSVMETDHFVAFPYESNESANMLTNVVRNKFVARPNTFKPEELDLGVAFFKLDGKIPEVRADGFLFVYPKPILKVEGEEGLTECGEFEVKLISELVSDIAITEAYENEYCWYNSTAGLALCRRSKIAVGADYNYSVLLKVNDDAFQTFLKGAKDTTYTDNEGVPFKEFILEYPNENLGFTDTDITTCRCATLFGVDGANDRIFLGGGTKGNMVYFSENDINFQPNPTYFPVNNFIVCGKASADVSGFLRVTDGRLAIFKDITNTEDVAVYYTSGYYVDHTDSEIGTTYKDARFTVHAGNIQRRGISARAVVNLEGDNIFTSAEGVYGIQLSNNVASGERYARERSRTINPKITKLGLNNAKGIVYEDKYFLAVDNGEVYVADARYKFTLQGDQQDTFNYEWFRLTGLWVKEWFILGGKLHFIDKDGYICEFTEGFADQYLVSSKDNELTAHREDEIKVEGGKVTFNSDRLPLIKASSYAIDHLGRTWQLELVDNDTALKIPEGITIADSADLDLWFCVPIAAYWQSAVMDLGAPIYLKNMWSLSMVASAKHGGKINLGYKTRMNAVSNIEVEGANEADFGTMLDNLFGGTQTSLLTGDVNSFGMYTFDVGGYVGINTYRRRLFDRNFAHIQLLFTSETTTDCAVAEMDIEYSISRKNIGVG